MRISVPLVYEWINNATEGQPLSVRIFGTQDLWWSKLSKLKKGRGRFPF